MRTLNWTMRDALRINGVKRCVATVQGCNIEMGFVGM